MNAKDKKVYEPPKVDIIRVVTEGIMATSIVFTDDLEWKPDPDPTPAPYDGDIWVNL